MSLILSPIALIIFKSSVHMPFQNSRWPSYWQLILAEMKKKIVLFNCYDNSVDVAKFVALQLILNIFEMNEIIKCLTGHFVLEW